MYQCEGSPNSTNKIKNKSTSIKYRNKQVEEADRKCLLCNSREVESEIHFLTQCPFLQKKRKTFYTFVSKIIPDFNTLEKNS